MRARRAERAGRLALLTGAVLLAACAAPQHQAPRATGAAAAPAVRPTIERVVVTATSVNLRAGPDTSNPVVGGARRGTPLEVIDRRGGWLEVRRGAGSAWIAARLTGPPGGRRVPGPDPDAPELPPIVGDAPPPPIAGEDPQVTTATAEQAGDPPPPPIADTGPARETGPLPPIGGDDLSDGGTEDAPLPGL